MDAYAAVIKTERAKLHKKTPVSKKKGNSKSDSESSEESEKEHGCSEIVNLAETPKTFTIPRKTAVRKTAVTPVITKTASKPTTSEEDTGLKVVIEGFPPTIPVPKTTEKPTKLLGNRKGKLSTRQIQKLKREKAHRDRVAMRKLNRERAVAKAKRALRDSLSDHDSDMVDSTLSDTTSEGSDSTYNEKPP